MACYAGGGAGLYAVLHPFIKQAHSAGQRDGMTRYAWWKDGVQYVGTTGTTLKEALRNLEPTGA